MDGLDIIHPFLMLNIAPERTRMALDKHTQAWMQCAVTGHSFKDGFTIADNTGFDAFFQPRAAGSGAALFLDILCAKVTRHIGRLILERVDIHGFLLRI